MLRFRKASQWDRALGLNGCSAATITTLYSTGDVGRYTSIAIGADGLALISYYDLANGDLKAAHCANLTCTPFFRNSRS